MSLLQIATIIFFIVYGIMQFIPFKYADAITGIAALIIGVITIISAV